MSDKPIIRHCRNCEYFRQYNFLNDGECEVKYKYLAVEFQRTSALFCRYYKQKGEEEE